MESTRHLFDIPDDLAYLNTAYMAPQLHSVGEAASWGMDLKRQPWTIRVEDFFEPSERVRDLVAQIFHSSSEEIALIPSVSYGIETAVLNTPIARGQNVVLIAEQFPSNVYPWTSAAQRADAEVRFATRDEQTLTDSVLKCIDSNTAAVSIPAVHWTDGEKVDLVAVRDATRRHGAHLVLDLTQSLGAMPFALDRIDPDFAVAAGYKWLLGPYASAYLYVAPRHCDGRPLENNWITRARAERFSELVRYTDALAPGARRFDVGERSNFVTLPMCEAALSQLLQWGIEPLYAHLTEMTDRIAQRAAPFGYRARSLAERGGHYLGLTGGQVPPEQLAQFLREQRVWVSVRGDSIRVTPHLYTSEDDIDRFLNALEQAAST